MTRRAHHSTGPTTNDVLEDDLRRWHRRQKQRTLIPFRGECKKRDVDFHKRNQCRRCRQSRFLECRHTCRRIRSTIAARNAVFDFRFFRRTTSRWLWLSQLRCGLFDGAARLHVLRFSLAAATAGTRHPFGDRAAALRTGVSSTTGSADQRKAGRQTDRRQSEPDRADHSRHSPTRRMINKSLNQVRGSQTALHDEFRRIPLFR